MTKDNNNIIEINDDFNLKQIFEQYAYYWKWFLFSTFFLVIASVIYLRYAENIYYTQTKILLQDESQSSDLAGLSELSSLSNNGNTSAYMADQMDVIKSRRI